MLDEKDLNKSLSRIYNTISTALDNFKGRKLTDDSVYNMRMILANALKPLLVGEVSNVKVDVCVDKEKPDTIRIKPLNLFTGLIMAGYYIPAGELEGKTEWTTDKFRMEIVGDHINIHPKEKI